LPIFYIGLAVLWVAGVNLLLGCYVDDPDRFGGIGIFDATTAVTLTLATLYVLWSGRQYGAVEHRNDATTRESSHQRRFIVLMIVLATSVPLLGSFVIHIHSPRLIEKSFDDLSAIADLKAGQIEGWLKERRKDMETLAYSPRFIARVHEYLVDGDASAGERVRLRMQDLTRAFRYDIDLLRPDGQTAIASRIDRSSLQPQLDKLLRAAFSSGQIQLIDLHRDPDDLIRLSYVVPLFFVDSAGERRNLAALVLHVPVESFLFPYIQTWPTASPSAETVLVHRDGEDALFLNKLRHRNGVELNQRYPLTTAGLPAAAAILSGRELVMEGSDYRRVPVVAATRPVKGTPWYLIAKMDRAEVMAPLKDLVSWINIVAFFAIVAVILTIHRLWQQRARTHALELQAQAAEKDRVLCHFYDLSLLGMAIAAPATRQTLHVNDELCRITGYTPAAMMQLPWLELIHPDHRQADLAEYARLMSGETATYARDSRLVRQNGAVIDVTVNAQCVRNQAGIPELVIATVQDVTARKRMERALRDSEANLNRAQQVARIGSWTLDVRSSVLTWSAECYRIFGLPQGTPLNYELFLDRVHPDDRAYVDRTWQAALQGASYDIEHRIVVAGQVKWIREQADLSFDAEGQLVWGIGTAQDITEHKETLFKLEESEAIRRQSQRIARLGHYVFDIEAGTWTSSDMLDEVFGIDDSYEKTIDGWLELMHPEQRGEMLCYLQDHVLRDGQPFDREYCIVRPSDGAVRWIHALGRLEAGGDDSFRRILGTIQDITDRVRVQTALRENEERLRQAVHVSEIGIFDHDHLTNAVYWSAEQRRIYGWGAAETVLPSSFLTRVYGEDQDRVFDAVRHAHDPAGDGLFDVEHRIIRCDGAIRWLAMRSQTIFKGEGSARRIVRTVGAVMDITERKRNEITLRESKEHAQALEERFRLVFENTLDGILVVDPDSGRFLMGNPAMARILACGAAEIPRLGIPDIVEPSNLAYALEQFERHKRGDTNLTLNFPLKRQDGSVVYINVHSTTLRLAGKSYLMGMVRDVTEQIKNEEYLRLAAAVFENSREGVMVTDAHQRILLVNRALCELKGYTQDELIGQRSDMLQSGRHGREFYVAMWDSIRNTGQWQGEIWNRHRSGSLTPVLLSISAIRDSAGKPTHYVGITTDISMQKMTEARLEFMAHHDSLTELPNRLLMRSRLEHSVEVARRENRRLALLMLDLDQFKDVNDSFGHLAGDELLQHVSKRLIGQLRGADTVARLGGDEFAVLLDNPTQQEDALRLANNIINLLSVPWHLANSIEVRIGVSVGISLFPEHGQNADILLQKADAALYRAKSEGRGCARFFSDDMTQAARTRLEIESKLRRALKHGELRVHYQPQLDMASGRIVGAEALLRWHEPERGMIPPGVFIPVAEDTGLISEIGAWVLQETCRQGRQWIELGLPPLTLSVNLSPHQFRFNDIGATVKQALSASGFPPERLELELTESALMAREGEAAAILDHLREQGVRLAIDDFGTGYSSLAYLKHFAIDVLKIDKRFIDDIPHKEDDKAITAAIVAMAHTLGFEVTAEGVETQEQLAFLRAQGCDRYQGYLASPAIPAEEFATLLTAGAHRNSRIA
jgi:diguanylate cyclase (GGDEF)-like protein/PAS domain S-box-containing protein